ncbi:MAG TPA: ABC transporter ATP-binding protein [Planctomycetaceae bacterium]|nr:ABC transporter ATP-binding protein [Planctomycetaceae bacterium]
MRALPADETLVAWVHCDVDTERRFRSTYTVLTNQRLFNVNAAGETTQSWPLSRVAKIKTRDRSGLGTLEALGENSRLAVWYYTIAQGPSVLVLIDRFEELRATAVPSPAASLDEAEPPEAETSEPPPNTYALFRLTRFARPHWHWVILAFVLTLTASVSSIVPAYLSQSLVDDVLKPLDVLASVARGEALDAAVAEQAGAVSQTQRMTLGAWLLLGMLGAHIGTWLLGWSQGAMLAWVSERVSADLRHKTYAHLQRLSLEYFGGKRTGDLISRLSTDSDRLCQFLADSVADFAADALLLVAIAVMLFLTNPTLAVITLLPFPFVIWLMYYSRDKLQTGFLASSNAWSAMNSVLADAIPGIRVVKAFAQEQREIDRFGTTNEHLLNTNNRVNAIWTFFWPLIAFLNNLGVLIVRASALYLISAGSLTLGEFFLFLDLSSRFYGRLESMTRMVNASQRAAASAQRIFEMLDRVSSVPEPARPVPLDRLRGDLEFRNVGFRYGNRKVIKDLSLNVKAGEMIGLVGHTGAGKSTLINLVCRFFDVAEGAIYADGIDIRSYNVGDYRRNIGIVLQEPFLFFGTVAENISYGRPEATRAEIIEAAKAAKAHDFILSLPDGYDSIVGERGQSLSGGERQRISIARALLINPSLLILDEATSAVDTQTEREIQEALQNLVRGRTTLAIAHRLSTLRQANRICVLDRGRIVEAGTHEELLALDGAYAALHRAQQELTKDIGW